MYIYVYVYIYIYIKPATTVHYLRSVDTRTPWDRNDSPMLVL